MSTHADTVREAERAVVEAAVAQFRSGRPADWTEKRHLLMPMVNTQGRDGTGVARSVRDLLSLRAATCPTCGGSGKHPTYDGDPAADEYQRRLPCPAGCERGKRRTT